MHLKIYISGVLVFGLLVKYIGFDQWDVWLQVESSLSNGCCDGTVSMAFSCTSAVKIPTACHHIASAKALFLTPATIRSIT